MYNNGVAKTKQKKNACKAGYGIIKDVFRDKDGRIVHVTKEALQHAAARHTDIIMYLAEIEFILVNYDERIEDQHEHGTSYIKVFPAEGGLSDKIKVVTHGCAAYQKAGAERRINHVSSVYRLYEAVKKK